jgi:GNAT superfamily N-acetyltransferase
MKYSQTLQFSGRQIRPWKHIIINAPFGNAILLNDEVVGGVLVRKETWQGGIKTLLIEGIEIEPEFRRKGIARAVVKMMLKQCDLLVGSITDDECKPFWQKMGAQFCPLPIDVFPPEVLKTITTKEPLLFFFAKTPEARAVGMRAGRELPDLLKKDI